MWHVWGSFSEIFRVWNWTLWKHRMKSVWRDASLCFSLKKAKVVSFQVSSPLFLNDATHLTFPLKTWQDEGRTALPAFVWFCLLWRKQTVYWFPVLRNCPLPFVKPCFISWALYPLNSTALPVFWQLNLPYFLVIINHCEVLTLSYEGACGQQFHRKAQPQDGLSDVTLSFQGLSIHFLVFLLACL